MKRRDLLFDLDGTIIDSFEGVGNSYRYALSQMGIAVKNEKELRQVIGPPLSESFERLYGLVGKDNENSAFGLGIKKCGDRGIGANAVVVTVCTDKSSVKSDISCLECGNYAKLGRKGNPPRSRHTFHR